MATPFLKSLSNVRSKRKFVELLKEEFERKGYKPDRPSVEKFVRELKREIPKLDHIVEEEFNGNGLLEILEDAYRIPGS